MEEQQGKAKEKKQKPKRERVKKEKTKKEKKPKDPNKEPLFKRLLFKTHRLIKRIYASKPVSKFVFRQRTLVKARCGTDEGYAEYAVKVKILRMVICALLVLMCIVALIFSRGRMGVDDIYYMARDIGYMNSYSESITNTLNYTKTSGKADFALYKKGLVAVSGSEVKLFNYTGRVTLTYGEIFSNPVVVASDKNVLIYDLGGKKLSVYNSFKKLRTLDMDGKIAYASMSEDGSFCVAIKTSDYNCTVHIYDEDCNKIQTFSSSKYAISAEMSENGKYTAVLAALTQNGKMASEITVLKNGRKKVYASFDTGELTPYMCKILDNNRIALFCDDRVVVYTLRGRQVGEYIYPDAKLSGVSFGENNMSLLFEEDLVNGQNTLVVLGKDGRKSYESKIQGSFTDMQIYGDYVFLLTNNGICKYNYKTKVTKFKESADTFGSILVCDESRVLVCTDSRGIYIDI